MSLDMEKFLGESNTENWGVWSKYVLLEIVKLNKSQENMQKKYEEQIEKLLIANSELQAQIAKLNTNIETLRTAFNIKSGVFGVVGGIISAIGVFLLRGKM